VPTLLTSTAIHSVRNSPMRNGAQGDEADIESAICPFQLPMGNAFGPERSGVSRYGQSGAWARQAVTVAIILLDDLAVA
jgi:hypothetical protein